MAAPTRNPLASRAGLPFSRLRPSTYLYRAGAAYVRIFITRDTLESSVKQLSGHDDAVTPLILRGTPRRRRPRRLDGHSRSPASRFMISSKTSPRSALVLTSSIVHSSSTWMGLPRLAFRAACSTLPPPGNGWLKGRQFQFAQ